MITDLFKNLHLNDVRPLFFYEGIHCIRLTKNDNIFRVNFYIKKFSHQLNFVILAINYYQHFILFLTVFIVNIFILPTVEV